MKKLLLFLFILFIAHLSFALNIKIPYGYIASFEGKPLVNNNSVFLNQHLFKGDLIITDANSSLKIVTKKQDKVYIGPNSRFVIKGHSIAKLKEGMVRAIVHKLLPKESFKISTSGGVAGVKGTEFIIYTKNKATAVFTKKGSVYVKNKQAFVVAKAYEMTQSAKNITPLKPVNFEKSPQLNNAFNILLESTKIKVPKSLRKLKQLPNIIARWNINYADYLVDKAEYREALKSLDIAYLFATLKSIKAEILYKKAVIESIFLKDYNSALYYLNLVIKDFSRTRFFENAMYERGFIEYERKNYKQAIIYFNEYKKHFPDGKFVGYIKLLTGKMNKQ